MDWVPLLKCTPLEHPRCGPGPLDLSDCGGGGIEEEMQVRASLPAALPRCDQQIFTLQSDSATFSRALNDLLVFLILSPVLFITDHPPISDLNPLTILQ